MQVKKTTTRKAVALKKTRQHPLRKDAKPTRFVIVDDNGDPLPDAKLDVKIADAYRERVKQAPAGEAIVLKGEIIHAFSTGKRPLRAPVDRVLTFSMKVDPAAGVMGNKAEIRKGLFQ